MSRIEMKVEGMTCEGCCGRLKRVLEGAQGVASAQVVLQTGQVVVDYDADSIDVWAIQDLVEDAGFSVQGG